MLHLTNLLVKRKLEHSQGCQKWLAAGENRLKLSDNPDSINQTNCLHPCTRRVLKVDSRRNNLSERGKGRRGEFAFLPLPFPVFHVTHSWLPQTRDHRLLVFFHLVKTSDGQGEKEVQHIRENYVQKLPKLVLISGYLKQTKETNNYSTGEGEF